MLTLKKKEEEKKEKDPAVFNTGDTVRLKSGGPSMTIEDIGEEGSDMVTVVYFDIAGSNFYRTEVSVVALRHFEPKWNA
jgi:uncharacterized protein YodC (DUF2158 family)